MFFFSHLKLLCNHHLLYSVSFEMIYCTWHRTQSTREGMRNANSCSALPAQVPFSLRQRSGRVRALPQQQHCTHPSYCIERGSHGNSGEELELRYTSSQGASQRKNRKGKWSMSDVQTGPSRSSSKWKLITTEPTTLASAKVKPSDRKKQCH